MLNLIPYICVMGKMIKIEATKRLAYNKLTGKTQPYIVDIDSLAAIKEEENGLLCSLVSPHYERITCEVPAKELLETTLKDHKSRFYPFNMVKDGVVLDRKYYVNIDCIKMIATSEIKGCIEIYIGRMAIIIVEGSIEDLV